MQWNSEPNAGFSTAEPWLPVANDYATCNVEVESTEPGSILTLIKSLLSLRRESPALHIGSYQTVPVDAENVLAYLRRHGSERIVVALNLGQSDAMLDLSGTAQEGDVLVSTYLDRLGAVQLSALNLRPDEGVVLRLAD